MDSGRSRFGWGRLIVVLTLALLLICSGFGAGVGVMWAFGPQIQDAVRSTLIKNDLESSEARASFERQMDILPEIWRILDREYIDPEALDPQKAIHGAASGLVSSLGDPYTAFVEPVAAAIINEDMSGSFEGIGASVEMVDGELTIVRLLPNSPAFKAGLKERDVVLEVDGVPLEGKSLMEAVSLIRGPKGTVVELLIRREGVPEPFLVSVTRDKVELETVESRMLEGGIAYLRLTEFNAVSADRVHEALDGLLKEAPSGLVFDLRGNPGGYLQMAVEVASEFLPKGSLVLQEVQRDRPTREYRVKRQGLATEIPLVVLVNRSSASASEIVAGAIRDNGRGVLVGEETFGKGSVQNTHTLENGASLRVTIARWLLPSGRNLDGQGIEPDIKVPMTAEDVAEGRDPQLERAIQYLVEG